MNSLFLPLLTCLSVVGVLEGNDAAKVLHNKLLLNYNKFVRPSENNSDPLTIHIGLQLSQILNVEWLDYRLQWNTSIYDNISSIKIQSRRIWLPDIVLHNNVDGVYDVQFSTKANVFSNGKVVWSAPAIFNSYCPMNVQYFPFDEQTCQLRFGSMTYNIKKVDIILRNFIKKSESDENNTAISFIDYYPTMEWDLLSVFASKYNIKYDLLGDSFAELAFNLTIRRKPLFYTVNLLLPCVSISFLAVLSFYLPAESGKKLQLCISILISLTAFFSFLNEVIVPTSLVVPLIAKYLLFTMVLVTASILMNVMILNIHHRTCAPETMPPWIKRIFFSSISKFLRYKDRVHRATASKRKSMQIKMKPFVDYSDETKVLFRRVISDCHSFDLLDGGSSGSLSAAIQRIHFIAHHKKCQSDYEETQIEWKRLASIIDRIFLWVFAIAATIGTCCIITQCPTLFDQRKPIKSFQENGV